jgi:hypothetical protein
MAQPEDIVTDPVYEPDFYDRDHDRLRCRVCGVVNTIAGGDGWLDARVRDAMPCPGCGLNSLIPTVEESDWPAKKDPDDPVAGISTVERPRSLQDVGEGGP